MTLDIVPPPSSMHSVLIKCFADEDALQYSSDHDARKPFKELRINCDEDAKQCRSSETSSDCTSSSSYDDLDMELSDGERETLVPVVDQLICGISADFLFDYGGPSLLDSLIGSRRQSSSRRIEAQPDAAKQVGAASQAVTAAPAQAQKTRNKGDEGLIKAQPAAPSQRANHLSAMIAEKSALKRELRSLDVEFEQREGRKPSKAEKEHLRPMYVRYWKLKHQISKMQNMGK